MGEREGIKSEDLSKEEYIRRIIRFFIVFGLLLSPFLLLQVLAPIYYDNLPPDKYPFLQWNNDPQTSISVMWETSFQAPTIINWGSDPENLNFSYWDSTPKNLHQVNITGLMPDSTYYYKISTNNSGPYKALGEGKIYAFKTAPNYTRPFSITVIGDNRENPIFASSAEEIIFKDIYDADPDFYISIGDIWEEGGNKHTVDRFFRSVGEIASNKTFMMSVGNHEIMKGGPELYLKYMNQPHEYTFGLNYSNVHFSFLAYPYTCYQSGEIKGNWLNETQVNWIKDDLSKNQDKDWRVVVIHSPIKSSAYFGEDSKAQRILVPLFEEYNVSLVFMGSDHHYEHLNIDGIDYFVTGGGGADLAFLGLTTNSTESFLINYQYLKVDFNVSQITIRCFKYDNTLVDSVKISK